MLGNLGGPKPKKKPALIDKKKDEGKARKQCLQSSAKILKQVRPFVVALSAFF